MATGSLFIRPAIDAFPVQGHKYLGRYATYSHYNYLRPGLIAGIKRHRLDISLRLAEPMFGRTCAIDMGCADGVMLPSLAKYFPHVAAIDVNADAVEIARGLATQLKLSNVELIHNGQMPFPELREKLAGHSYGLMFLLETLEHVGRSPGTMYEDKIQFLEDSFSLLEPDGVIIVSVPKMVGLSFLLKHVVQIATRMPHEPISFKETLRAGFLCDVSSLQPRWTNGHVGFDDRKLERLIAEKFVIVARRNLSATRLWTIRRRS